MGASKDILAGFVKQCQREQVPVSVQVRVTGSGDKQQFFIIALHAAICVFTCIKRVCLVTVYYQHVLPACTTSTALFISSAYAISGNVKSGRLVMVCHPAFELSERG